MADGLGLPLRNLKRALLTLMTGAAGIPYWRPLVSDVAILFMLHRFTDPDRGVAGVSAQELRSSLAFLRRHRFRLASFQDLLTNGCEGTPSRRAGDSPLVLFTVDDGYAEFASIAAPIFAEFDCPVTVFLTTGPVDTLDWFWWDRVEYVISATTQTNVQLELQDHTFVWRWDGTAGRKRAATAITEQLKVVANDEKFAALARLAQRLEVDLPAIPPTRYAPMSWSDVRRCVRLGVTFGPHTVTHPMLPQISDERAEWEVVESWRRLREQCDATVPVFSYPNGAFSPRDVAILSRTDLVAGVTTKPCYASPMVLHARSTDAPFNVPRFNYPSDRAEFVSIVTGLDRVNSLLRQGTPGWRCVG